MKTHKLHIIILSAALPLLSACVKDELHDTPTPTTEKSPSPPTGPTGAMAWTSLRSGQ